MNEISIPISVIVTIFIFISGVVFTLLKYIFKIKAEDTPEKIENNFKAWEKQHDIVHSKIDATLKSLESCNAGLKREFSEITGKCEERCRQQDLIFEKISETLEKLTNQVNTVQISVATLTERVEGILIREGRFDGPERREKSRVI